LEIHVVGIKFWVL